MIKHMIFNFDFVKISSIAGLKEWGEFKDADKMVQKLEELRKNEELHATDHGVLMTGYMQPKLGEVKKSGIFRLAYLQDKWVICLNMPTSSNKRVRR